MRLKGFEIEYRFVDKGAYHCYIKFPSILYHSGLTTNDKEKIHINIDSQSKISNYKPTIFTVNKLGVYRDINAVPIDVLLAQKLITVLQRNKEKGRDLFDVSFLYGFTQPNFDYIHAITGLEREEFIKRLFQRVDNYDIPTLARDVEYLLFDPSQVNRVLGFQTFIHQQLRY